MPWIAASLVSAFFLGLYDLSKKHALRDNAVLPVLFLSTVCGAAVWLLLLLLAGGGGNSGQECAHVLGRAEQRRGVSIACVSEKQKNQKEQLPPCESQR